MAMGAFVTPTEVDGAKVDVPQAVGQGFEGDGQSG